MDTSGKEARAAEENATPISLFALPYKKLKKAAPLETYKEVGSPEDITSEEEESTADKDKINLPIEIPSVIDTSSQKTLVSEESCGKNPKMT